MAREFRVSILALLSRNGLDVKDVHDVAAGLAGADSLAQTRTLERLLREMGFSRVQVCNDGYLPVFSECAGGAGIAYNCGTGVCCTAVDPAGRMTKLGGLDEWSGDAGGGVWLLQQIFTAVYNDAALSLGETALTGDYADALGIAHGQLAAQLDESLLRVKADSSVQHRLIASVFRADAQGDAAAQEICARMIGRAADYIGAAYALSQFGEVPVQIVLSGSILCKAAPESFLNRMKAAVERRIGRNAQWLTPRNTPVHGAAVWLEKRNA